MNTENLCLYLLAILFPPIPVFLKRGCEADLLINVILCLIGWIPGILHAWYIIAKNPNS